MEKVMANNSSQASGGAENVYTVRDVSVSYSSTDAKKAKEEAIKIAQRQALKLLFRRAGIDDTHTRFLDDSMISQIVESIRIADEVITKESYSSKMTILFNKEFINFNLKRLNIGANVVKDEVYLYIPIFEDKNGKINLLDGDDIWYKAAYDNYFENNYENIFIIDNYSLSNAGLISKNKLKDIKYDLFRTLLKKYESDIIILAVAKYNSRTDSIDINLKKIDAENIDERNLNFLNRNNSTEEELIREASIRTLELVNTESQTRMMEMRKDNDGLEKIKKNSFIDVYIVITNLKDYVYVKNLINNLDFIDKYETLEMTSKMATIRLHYKIDESEIISLFADRGFILTSRSGKNFLVYRGF
jgi:hypothetical protein